MLFQQPPLPPPPQPPPLAFRSAALDRAAHTIDVDIMAAAQVSATVIIQRHGVRLGRAGGTMDRGGTLISVRIGPKGISPSALHQLAIKGRQAGTHVTRTPRLLYDVSVWNKLFRRAFWDQHELVFPEGVVWEDLRLMARAHVLAKAVDVIPDVVYYWR